MVAMTAAACAVVLPGADGVRWESRDDGTPPSMADSGDCRAQARRQASMRFPPRVQEVALPSGGRTSVTLPSDDPGRSGAESWFYSQCMRQKGFQLVSTPS